MRFPSPSPESTAEAGRLLAGALADEGLVIALEGPLGAGKTVFVKGLAEGLGIDPAAVTSPTFVIASEYVAPGGRRLAHVDCYRVRDRDELLAAGFLDLLAPGAVVAVEWSDRAPGALPEDRLLVRVARGSDAGSGPDDRVLFAVASGDAAAAVLARWQSALGIG